jgi:hypothetical protein
MNAPSTPLRREAAAPFTHIFLSLDLLESGHQNDENRSYLTIIRKNTERLQRLIQCDRPEILTE